MIVTDPPGATVYIGPLSAEQSVENPAYGFNTTELLARPKYRVGVSPVRTRVEPGRHLVAMFRKGSEDDTRWLENTEPGMVRGALSLLGQPHIPAFVCDGNKSVHVIVLDHKVHMIGKLYEVAKEDGQAVVLKVSMQPRIRTQGE